MIYQCWQFLVDDTAFCIYYVPLTCSHIHGVKEPMFGGSFGDVSREPVFWIPVFGEGSFTRKVI